MHANIRLAILLGCAIALATQTVRGQEAPRAEVTAVGFFEKRVRPILVKHCYACHSADTKPAGGLRVDDRNGLLRGGNSGEAVVPGKPEESLLLQRVTHKDAKKRMPREGDPLSDEAIADLTTWIKDGAAWPAPRVPAALGKPKPKYEKLKKEHWAWQPLTHPEVPAVSEASWPRDDIDRFVLARLDAKELRPIADADKATLLRRVTFDLTGLPPTPVQLDAFLRDSTPQAFERVVDRLLASPQFGERWGRHWLDVARYGESTGPSRNIPYPHAWRYRDYVIDAFNRDVPYDRFIREQVAGDLLPADEDADRDRLLTATGFLALGVKDVNQRFKERFLMDNVDEQVDAVTRSILGMTASCARCHDHKFDPIPTTDYYALAGIFTSTDNCAGLRNQMGGAGLAYYVPGLLVKLSTQKPEPSPEQVAKLKEDLAKAKGEWEAIRGTPEGLARGADGQPKQRPYRLKFERLQAEYLALTDPAQRGDVVHGVRDAQKVGDTEVRLRGEAEKLGPTVPRGFLSAIVVPGATPINPKQSGRLELAQWLSSPHNPLTSRVMVNRVWEHLFGQGIVTTVDNFGVMGDTPSHPELLDHLAQRFIRDGWSVKKLVRSVVLTRTYQLASTVDPDSRAAFNTARSLDPANRLLWRHSPRRLDAEEIRDATLAAAGTLDLKPLAGSPAKTFPMIEMRDNGVEARYVRDQADRSLHRSVYLPLLRGVTPRALEAFDPVEQTLVTGSRDTTTVPGQALHMLNSSFVRRQALALAETLLADKESSASTRIETAYQRTLGRAPTEKEAALARLFLTEYEAAYRVLPEPPMAPKAAPVEAPKPAFGAESNPDQADRADRPFAEEIIVPKDAPTAAWMSFAQVLFASAEFRFVR